VPAVRGCRRGLSKISLNTGRLGPSQPRHPTRPKDGLLLRLTVRSARPSDPTGATFGFRAAGEGRRRLWIKKQLLGLENGGWVL
jgi:hypothetical protein